MMTFGSNPVSRMLPRLHAVIQAMSGAAIVLVLALPWSIVQAENLRATGPAESIGAYPAGLDEPAIDIDLLQVRLTPLTLEVLRPLAVAWQANARYATQAAVDKSLQLRFADAQARDTLREERLALLRERGYIFEKFLAVVSNLEAKGGDPSQVAELRAYVSAITSREAASMTPQEYGDSVLRWLASPSGGMQIVFRIAVIAGSLLGLFIIARIVRNWAEHMFKRTSRLSKLLRGFLVMVVYCLTIAFGLMIVLAALGVNITPLFALFGGASFIIAFALQDTLGKNH